MTKESEKEKRNGRERIKNWGGGGAGGVKISFIRDVTSRTINEPI